MSDHNVALLDTRGVGGGRIQEDVCEILHLAARFACHGDDFHTHLLGHLKGFEDVFGVSGGGDAHDDVALFRGAAQKPREDEVVAVVVAHGSEVGGVAVERFGVKRRTVEVETTGEFGSEMLRIGGTTAVAAEVDFASITQGCDNDIRRLLDAVEEFGVIQNRLFRGDGLFDGLRDSWVHITIYSLRFAVYDLRFAGCRGVSHTPFRIRLP